MPKTCLNSIQSFEFYESKKREDDVQAVKATRHVVGRSAQEKKQMQKKSCECRKTCFPQVSDVIGTRIVCIFVWYYGNLLTKNLMRIVCVQLIHIRFQVVAGET